MTDQGALLVGHDPQKRREAFLAIAAFAQALTEYERSIAEEEWYSKAWGEVITTARSAAPYFHASIRTVLDRALGVVDAQSEIAAELGTLGASRSQSEAEQDSVRAIAAKMILRELLGLPKPRVWDPCPQCGIRERAAKAFRMNVNGAAQPCCYDCSQKEAAAQKALDQARATPQAAQPAGRAAALEIGEAPARKCTVSGCTSPAQANKSWCARCESEVPF